MKLKRVGKPQWKKTGWFYNPHTEGKEVEQVWKIRQAPGNSLPSDLTRGWHSLYRTAYFRTEQVQLPRIVARFLLQNNLTRGSKTSVFWEN